MSTTVERPAPSGSSLVPSKPRVGDRVFKGLSTGAGVLIFVILGATSRGAPAGFAGIAIGLCLTLIHLVSIPVTNTSVNPARSTGVALFADGPALAQLWFFWVMPLVGAVIGAVVWKVVSED